MTGGLTARLTGPPVIAALALTAQLVTALPATGQLVIAINKAIARPEREIAARAPTAHPETVAQLTGPPATAPNKVAAPTSEVTAQPEIGHQATGISQATARPERATEYRVLTARQETAIRLTAQPQIVRQAQARLPQALVIREVTTGVVLVIREVIITGVALLVATPTGVVPATPTEVAQVTTPGVKLRPHQTLKSLFRPLMTGCAVISPTGVPTAEKTAEISALKTVV